MRQEIVVASVRDPALDITLQAGIAPTQEVGDCRVRIKSDVLGTEAAIEYFVAVVELDKLQCCKLKCLLHVEPLLCHPHSLNRFAKRHFEGDIHSLTLDHFNDGRVCHQARDVLAHLCHEVVALDQR